MSSMVLLVVVVVFVRGTEAGFLSRSNNITVVGSVYCDACSNNTFSKPPAPTTPSPRTTSSSKVNRACSHCLSLTHLPLYSNSLILRCSMLLNNPCAF
jgi:hypothetical protein